MPKQFKTNEFQNGMFLKPSSYYKYRADNLQHSVVNDNESQSRNSRAEDDYWDAEEELEANLDTD